MTLFLIARMADRTVAIPSEAVDSVVDIAEVTPVPRAPAHVSGLAALRSQVVTVIDTNAALGLASKGSAGHRAVITRCDGHHYAILVEALEDVAPFEMTPLTAGFRFERGWRAVARGVIERDGEPILVIDPAALVPGYVAA